jgi:hypothetical protein
MSRRITTASAIVLAGAFVLWASPAKAQGSAECGASTDSIKACADEIFTAQIDLLNEVEGLITETQGLRMYALGAQASQVDDDLMERIEALRDERKRGKEANDDAEEADYDEMIGQANRQKGKKCKWEEVLEVDDDPEGFVPTGLTLIYPTKLGNEKCDVFTALDAGGKTVKVHERKQNLCERVCEETEAKKKRKKDRVVGRMNDGLSATLRASERIKGERVRIAQLGVRISSAADICEPVFEIPFSDPIGAGALVALSIVTEVLDAVRDSGERGSDQTAAGFNCAVCAIALEVAFHVSNGAKDIVETGMDLLGSFQTDAILNCVQSIKSDSETLKLDAAAMKADIAELLKGQGGVNAVLEELKGSVQQNQNLLLTPQGQRDGFPLK